jgi:hypothetical protein
MTLRKTAKTFKQACLTLMIAGAIMCITTGCNAIGALGELNYLKTWAGSLFGTTTTG